MQFHRQKHRRGQPLVRQVIVGCQGSRNIVNGGRRSSAWHHRAAYGTEPLLGLTADAASCATDLDGRGARYHRGMSEILRVSDGSKAANFDGFTLEVSGINGSHSRRLAVESIEKVAAQAAGTEVMFGVKAHRGGFAIFGSLDKLAEWEALASAVTAAIEALPKKS
jgi:hypothetical protein